MEKDVTDEEYERVKKYIHEYMFVDLVLWRNEMIDKRKINNRLYHLIDNEIARRSVEIYERERKKAGK